MRAVALIDVDIDGEINDVRINGVEVVPLVEAEPSLTALCRTG